MAGKAPAAWWESITSVQQAKEIMAKTEEINKNAYDKKIEEEFYRGRSE